MVIKILLIIAVTAASVSIARAIKNIYSVKKSQKELDRALREYAAVKHKKEEMMSARDAINLLIASMNEAAMKGWRE